MTPSSITLTQLQSVVERAQRKNGGRRPIIVSADPGVVPLGPGPDVDAFIRGSSSPLEIRSLVARHKDEQLVVLTDCDLHDLGDDLRSRIAGERIWTLDRWETVKELFSARAISRGLARKRYLADALIEARPLNGYPPVRTGILDTETALSALLREYLKISSDVDTLDGFLKWAVRPEAASLLAGARDDVARDVRRLLIDRFGVGTEAVLSILRAGVGDSLIPLGLVGQAAYHPQAIGAEGARIRLEVRLDDQKIPAAEWRSLGIAAERYVRNPSDPASALAYLAQSDVILSEIEGSALAYLSDVIPSGFEQRLDLAARDLSAWMQDPDDVQRADSVHSTVEFAARHLSAETDRVERLRMATRLIRRGAGSIEWGDRLSDAARSYQADGAWFDQARILVSRGETNPALDSVYSDLTERANTSRAVANEAFAEFHRSVSGNLPDDVLGLEDVMDAVVAPIATSQPVLVVVLDGMGWPAFIEVYNAMVPLGWTWWRDNEGRYQRPAVAVLPTVTEFSRTSLFAGQVRKGTGESETRAFAEHEALLSASQPELPPVLYHKAQLRQGGIDTVPEEILSDIGNHQQQVVAVVLNNIDERLKDVAAPPGGWGLAELDPLRWLLSSAQDAGRVVIITADHGHILDRGAVQVSSPGGGERWKLAESGAADGEIEVSGPRVIGPSGSGGDQVVLPWVEQRHYGVRRNGYHGGFTPQEVLVPLAVFSVDDQPEGWSPVSFSTPDWWYHRAAVEPVVVVAPSPTTVPGETASLFDPIEDAVETSWSDVAVAALRELRTPQIRITDDEVGALLRVLSEQGGMAISETRLAEMSGLPPARIGRYISQLQQLVNIDGYGVVTTNDREVRLDRPMLDRQLGIS